MEKEGNLYGTRMAPTTRHDDTVAHDEYTNRTKHLSNSDDSNSEYATLCMSATNPGQLLLPLRSL